MIEFSKEQYSPLRLLVLKAAEKEVLRGLNYIDKNNCERYLDQETKDAILKAADAIREI